MNTLSLSYDPDSDTLTIEGVAYSGDFFRSFSVRHATTQFFIERGDERLILLPCGEA